MFNIPRIKFCLLYVETSLDIKYDMIIIPKRVVINVSGQSLCCHDKQSSEEDVAACASTDFDSLGTFGYCNHHTYCGCNLNHSVEEWCNFC